MRAQTPRTSRRTSRRVACQAGALVATLLVALTAESVTFSTAASAAAPTPAVTVATNLSNTSATLNGTVDPDGTSTTLTFCYSTSAITVTDGKCTVTSGTIDYATADQSPSSSATTITVTATVSGLAAGTEYYYAIGASQVAGTTVWSTSTADFTTLTGGPFTCTPEFYQVNGDYFWKFDPVSNTFVKVNTTAQADALNGIGYDTVDNYIYGVNGSTIYQIGNDGNETKLGTPSNISNLGGDFLPGTNFLLTVSGTGTIDLVDVASPVSPPTSVAIGTTTGSASFNAYDITEMISGDDYVGYGLGETGTTATLYKMVIPIADIPSSSSTWGSTSFTHVATVTSVGSITFSGGTAPDGDDFGADYSDNAGNVWFYADTAQEVYEATAADLASGTSFALTYVAKPTGLATGANDGASCPNTESPFAPPVPENDSYTVTAGSTLTVNSSTNSLLSNDWIAPYATVTMGTTVLEPGASQVSKTFSSSVTSGTLTGQNGTLDVTNAADGYFTFTPNDDFSGPETFTYNLVETSPNSTTSATSATVTIDVDQAQVVNWDTQTDLTTSSLTSTPTAATDLGDAPITYSLVTGDSNTADCSVDPSTGAITYEGAGVCTVEASAAATSTYSAASTELTFTITSSTVPTFTWDPSPTTYVVGTSPQTPASATTNSGGAITYAVTSAGTTGCTINTDTSPELRFTAAGQCAVTATVAAHGAYASDSITVIFNILAVPTFTWAPSPTTFTVPQSPQTIASATTNSDGAVTYAVSANTAGCSLATDTAPVDLSFTGSGSCTVTASLAASSTYTSESKAVVFTINKATQAITFTSTAPSGDVVGNTYTVTATGGGSGEPVTFSIDASSTSGCTINTTTDLVTFSGPAGTCVIDANQAGDAGYTAAPQVQQTITIGKASQAITFTSTAPVGDVVGNTYHVTATGGGSGNAVTFSIDGSSTSGCTINTTTDIVTFSGPAGTCVIDANQAGNSSYANATQAQQTVTVGKDSQAITFTSTAPVGDVVGNTYHVTATGGGSGNAVTFSIDGSSTSGCTINTTTDIVTFSGPAGSCVIDANQAGNTSYNAAPQVQQTVTVGKDSQAITFTSTAPVGDVVGNTYHVTATGGGSGNAVTFSIDGSSTSGCTINTTTDVVTFSGPAGSCVIDANQAGNTSYNAAPQVQQTVTVGKASQAITFTSTAPVGDVVGNTYTVTATGGASGNAVTFSIDGSSTSGCTINTTTDVVTFSGPAGSCVIDANQAGNGSYNAAPQAQQTVTVGKDAQAISITSTAPVGDVVGDTYDATATGGGSGNPIVWSIDASSTSGCTINSSTGVVTFATPAGSCVIDANQAGNGSYNAAPQAQQTVTVGEASQTITITSTAPVGDVVGDTYDATATGGASGNPIVWSIDGSSTSGCTINSSTGVVTMTGPAGTCVIDANQAGNGGYDAASQVQQTVTYDVIPQTITFTSTAPIGDSVGATYDATATGGGSGNPILWSIDASSTSGCTIDPSTGIVTLSAPAGTCVIDANQDGNGSYGAAEQQSQTVTYGLIAQTITFTSTAPVGDVVGDTYDATATGGGSGNPIVWSIDASSTSGCTIDPSSGDVTFASPAGSCVIDANQAGNDSYDTAAQQSQTVTVGEASQTIAFTSTAPVGDVVGDTYDATATGGGSGNPILWSIDASSTSGCTIDPSTGIVTLSEPAGTCVIDANQDGNGGYEAADQAQQTVTYDVIPQAITFTSTAPVGDVVGDTYGVTATGGDSGNPVTFTIDASSTSGCTIDTDTNVVTFAAPAGTCVIDANQAGNASYGAADQVQQTVTYDVIPQVVTITSTAPVGDVVGATYDATATGGGSGNPIVWSIDASSTSGCTIDPSSGEVTFSSPAGNCVIDANQAGDESYGTATEGQQTVTVGQASQSITFTSTAPANASIGQTYDATATGGGSGNPILWSIDGSSTSGCTIDPSTGIVTFTAPVGTCVIDANQDGNGGYLAAPQVQQSITVYLYAQAITFTSTAPVGDVVGDTYGVTATGGDSGNPVTFTIDASSTSGCTINTDTDVVTFAAPAGSCVIDANQTGNDSYEPAPQVSQTVDYTLIPQAITFTSTPPATPELGDTYVVSATGGESGNPVTFSIDDSSTSGCTIDSLTDEVTFTAPIGSCIIDANQEGTADYAAAAQVSQTMTVRKDTQHITFTSTPHAPAVHGTYQVTAHASSGLRVTFGAAAGSHAVCTVTASGAVRFIGPGTCIIKANQAGNGTYSAAPQALQRFTVRSVTTTVTLILHFANGSWALSAQSRAQLHSLALKIRADHLTKVTIAGYASSTGSVAGNDALGLRRAHAAQAYLLALLKALRVKGVRISSTGKGASHFLVHPTSSPLNRRDQITAT